MTPPPDDTTPMQPVRWARRLSVGQRAELWIVDVDTGSSRLLLHSTQCLFEAPHWHPSGRWIVVNADGGLFRIEVDAPSGLVEIPTPGLQELNNDHLLSPDGRWHLLSANDGHLYRMPWEGGPFERLSTPKADSRRFRHFLHGVSPDGRTLAYVGTEHQGGDDWGRRALWLLDLVTGEEQLVGDGCSPADGPEFSPDGCHLFFNSEMGSSRPGHAQIFRRDLSDGTTTQLTSDDRVNWFPHPSPDGRCLAYLSYQPGTTGHPADCPVVLRLMDLPDGASRDLLALFGGQGTINVPSWAPDSRRLACVAYPVAPARGGKDS